MIDTAKCRPLICKTTTRVSQDINEKPKEIFTLGYKPTPNRGHKTTPRKYNSNLKNHHIKISKGYNIAEYKTRALREILLKRKLKKLNTISWFWLFICNKLHVYITVTLRRVGAQMWFKDMRIVYGVPKVIPTWMSSVITLWIFDGTKKSPCWKSIPGEKTRTL